MLWLARLIALTLLMVVPTMALSDDGDFAIKADDGSAIANHRVPAGLESQIEALPGVVVVGHPRGKVTLAEFYDLNCPYCRRASDDIAALLHADPELRMVLVPFPVLGIPSIQGTRVELAVARLAPQKFYAFHRKLYEGRGVIDGNRALAAGKAIGLDVVRLTEVANDDALGQDMIAHVRLGDALAIQATPGFVIKGVTIVGYPGPKAMAAIIQSVQRCDAVVCERAPH
jgi:protein-disulfide isomerase